MTASTHPNGPPMISNDEPKPTNTIATPERQTLDVKDSAVELGVCEETVRRLVRRKVLRKLPGIRHILIPKSEIQRYLNVR